MNQEITYIKITLYGLVQGIGFRPYVVRLAKKWSIKGEVCNLGGAVRILAAAPFTVLEEFLNDLKQNPPELSEIVHIKHEWLQEEDFNNSTRQSPEHVLAADNGDNVRAGNNNSELGKKLTGTSGQIDKTIDEKTNERRPIDFKIVESESSEGLVILPPDLPVCDNCLNEMHDPENRRFKHHLISCTLCGPRYSIIKKAPYDRCNTAMEQFQFCPECYEEYTTVGNRRFHAQTVSCHHCGPQLKFIDFASADSGDASKNSEIMTFQDQDAIDRTIELISNGKVVAVKGIGGYHFIADPYSDTAVKELRLLKEREQKPFAVCFKDLAGIKEYARVSKQEEELLGSKARPIVLLKQKMDGSSKLFSGLVVQNSRYLGAFIAYTPILVTICEAFGPVIATSANLTDAPIINEDSVMLDYKSPFLSGILTHDREIMISQDDSVAWVVNGKPQVIRRARGYTPLPLYISPFEGQEEHGVLAFGGELKSSFCMQKGPFAYISQYLGDLGSQAAQGIYRENLTHMRILTGIKPNIAACDLHPDYASTHMAQELGLPVIKVQHHHAHVAAVMAEKGLSGPILGVAFDGTGYGTDGTVWGGEFLLCKDADFTRMACLKPIPMLGGDESMRDCQKAATAYLHAFGLSDEIRDERYAVIKGALKHNVNTILNSSMGRLFDAVSSILGLCQKSRYEAEGAILLENKAAEALDKGYSPYSMSFGIIEQGDTLVLDSEPLIKTLIKGLREGILIEELALGFHEAVSRGTLNVLVELREKTQISDVVLSGGVFQNKILTEKTIEQLEQLDFIAHIPVMVPPNDGSISLGQAYVAMKSFKQRG